MAQLTLFQKNYEKNILGGNLSKLSNVCDDEIYTTKEMVEAMLDPHLDYLKTKRILFPCDKDESEFVKYAEKHLLDFQNSSSNFRDLSEHDISRFDIIITNPPFSLKKDFILKFKHKEIWMVGLLLFATNKTFKSIAQNTYFDISYCGKLSFIRNGKPYKIIGSPIFYYYKPEKNIKEWFFNGGKQC